MIGVLRKQLHRVVIAIDEFESLAERRIEESIETPAVRLAVTERGSRQFRARNSSRFRKGDSPLVHTVWGS